MTTETTELKGLHVSIFRSDYDARCNEFFGKQQITLVRVIRAPHCQRAESVPINTIQPPDLFPASDERPPAELVVRFVGDRPAYFIRPYGAIEGRHMSGGTFANCCDSRFSNMLPFYGAVGIHDRVEQPLGR